jgi:hypothetical protein
MIAALIISNSAGYLLKSNGFARYAIFMGFRFHISIIVPFLTLLPFIKELSFSSVFTKVPNKKYYMLLIWVLFPLAISVIAPLLFGLIELNDPDYFYEFGLSSIIDYPVYLFWNLPQLFALGIFLLAGIKTLRLNAFVIAIFIATLFIYEFIPAAGTAFDFVTAACLIVVAVSVSFVLVRLKNIYLFSAALFSALWSGALVLGSNSKMLINLIFARQYSAWDGFFIVNSKYSDYALLVFLGLSMIVILFSTAITDIEK